jgi:ammonium transporter, Amt family
MDGGERTQNLSTSPFFDNTCSPVPFPSAFFSPSPHSLFILGVLILWFGWYGFNPGSQQAITGATNFMAVSNAAVATTLAPSAAGLSALLIGALESKIKTGKAMYGVENMGNGALAGLAAITASCNVVYPWAAIIIGSIAGGIYLGASKLSVLMKLDDPLDAVAVHAWNGMWGVIAAGLFSSQKLVEQSYGTGTADAPIARRSGAFLGGGGAQLAAQLAYLAWVAVWVLGNMVPFWFILKKLGFLRVPSDEEIVGLDHSYHGGSAYPGGPEEAEDASLKAGGGAGAGGKELAGLKAELAALKATVGKLATA